MDKTVLEKAKTFIYSNGRLLDRRRFEYLFEGGSQEAVISALAAYQNEDGGFGNALEPDIRCPHSQPVPTEFALTVMDELGYFDKEIIAGVARYLKKITVQTGGFPLAFRELNDYPHAPWWKVKEDNMANINPTGRIIGLLLKQDVVTEFFNEAWFERSLQYVWGYIENGAPAGYHDGVQWISFLEHTPDRSRAEATLASKVDPFFSKSDSIERDHNAEGYVQKVLDWAPSRESCAAKFITEEEFQTHLHDLIKKQQEDGGWPIFWPELSPGVGMEWRGSITVDRLKTLSSFGLL